MVRYQFILYLEPHKKSNFYQTMEKFLLSSLAHYGLHEGTMFPPHCDMTHLINKGIVNDYPSISSIVIILDRLVELYSPFVRPKVGTMMPINNKVVRENLLCIPLNVQAKDSGIGAIVRKPYHFMMNEFRYDAFKHCGLTIVPGKMVNMPLVYNYDKRITEGKVLSKNELQLLWDLAQETIDFKDAQICAWHCTLYQVRRSNHFDKHHFFVEHPVKSWEVAREIVPKKRWVMDWP